MPLPTIVPADCGFGAKALPVLRSAPGARAQIFPTCVSLAVGNVIILRDHDPCPLELKPHVTSSVSRVACLLLIALTADSTRIFAAEAPPLAPEPSPPSGVPAIGREASEPGDAPPLDPDHPDAHLTRGVESYAHGDYPGAIAELTEVLKQVPEHAYARHYLALALAKQRAGEPPTMDGEDIAGPAASLRRGTACLAAGNAPCAVMALREATQAEPTAPHAHDALGLALAQLGDVDAAIEAYRAALRVAPAFAPARVHLATALMTKQQWGSAANELEAAIRTQPDLVQAHTTLGALRYATGDVPGAIAAYRRAITLQPEFPDAHHHLGLLLKLRGHEKEATAEFLIAAQAGVPMAQYFLGTAYASGAGMDRDLVAAVTWYFRAADHGDAQAQEALGKLRRTALLGIDQAQAREASQAFATYRAQMRRDYSELAGSVDDLLGAALLRQGRTDDAVTVLIREAAAVSEPAQALLETWYEQGVEGQLPAHDSRILGYLKAGAGEGLPRPRRALARIYARGLGVEPDLDKAAALLKGDRDDEAQRLLKEITAAKRERRPLSPIP